MGYGQTATIEQIALFTAEKPTRTKRAGVPIYKVALVRESKIHCYETRVSSSATASALLQKYLDGVDREHFVILMLDRKNRVIGIHTVSVGSLTASVVHPREVYKAAILSNCAALILAHNHPSGDPQPSQEDRVMTKRLVEAGKLLGISVLDHIIIGDGGQRYFSFADEGVL
jgi:DNA repair protein RadC